MSMKADYERIALAIRYLDAEALEQPRLSDVAAEVGLSEFHFQKLFQRWAGVSPKRFLQHGASVRAIELLRRKSSTLDASLQAGLSGPGRLHDLTLQMIAMTPGEIQKLGQGLRIEYGFEATPFGEALIASTHRGLCHLSFSESREEGLRDLARQWPAATLVPAETLRKVSAAIFDPLSSGGSLALCVRGTNFQVRVWEALLKIPEGRLTTYGDLARSIGSPGASRAVGSAVGDNPIAYLIPCHRVIRSTGAFGQYRWGAERKRAMIAYEALRFQSKKAAEA
jgi:AraC family transcriptional regulator of adaptative response/methylated-DNA-[protein]-cysteine methyltransferase